MVKSEDFDLGNFGRNAPDSSSKFLGAVGGAVVDTQVDSDTGDSVLPISGKRLVFGIFACKRIVRFVRMA